MPHYYVEMPNSPSTTTNNHEENQLVVDLEDVYLESKDLISSNQREEVGLAHLLSLPTLPTRKDKVQQTASGLFQFTCGNIKPISGCPKT
jgi:hypothetical protein